MKFLLAILFAFASAAYAEPGVLRARPVAPELQRVQQAVAAIRAGKPSELRLELFADAAFSLRFHRAEVARDGSETLFGGIEGDPFGSAIVVINRRAVSANIVANGRMFQIRYRGGGAHEAREVRSDATAGLEADPPATPPKPKAAAPITQATAMTDDGSIIDLLVLYTADARIAASPDDNDDATAIQSQVNLAVAETNAAYERSNVTQRLRLVYTAETPYVPLGHMPTDLTRLKAPADGFVDEAHTLRDTYGADLVSLWIENGGGAGGAADIMDPVSNAFATQAFSVIERRRATDDTYALAHFLGRNMGVRPDIFVDPTPTPYAYAHGYVDVVHTFRDLMGMNDACFEAEVNCTRIPYFGNPSVLYNGFPTGNASNANAAATLNQTAFTVANFRATVAIPGVLSFSPSAYSVNEFAGAAALSVVRTLDTFGAVSVQYATVSATGPGIATAGSDYTVTAGTLSWAHGESGAKSFAVPISHDGANEGNETFTVTLSNPTGGASLATATATVSILESSEDAFPRNCALPTGWVKPSGAAASWVLDTSESTEGRCSLRSGAVGDSQVAQIEFTGTFLSGDITFRRKVSSELDYDCFRFYIGTTQMAVGGTCANTGGTGASGELGWQLITVPVTAGTKTLRWSFERDFSDGFGANAAWIDDVVLPMLGTTTTLGASPNPSTSGQSVTFTATVTRSTGSGTPTGTVLFKADGTAIAGCAAAPLGSPTTTTTATATCATTTLTGGTHSITAEYSGSSSLRHSLSSPLTQTVNGFALSSVVSRKTHGAAGPLELPVDATQPVTDAVSVEPRVIGSGHAIVFNFNGNVTTPGTASATDVNGAPIGSASTSGSGREVVVSLTGVNNLGTVFSPSVGFLLADVDGTRVVANPDVVGVQGQSGKDAIAATARYDLNLSGAVTATDILMAKGRVGNAL